VTQILSKHHGFFPIPRHIYQPFAIENSAVNRHDGVGGNRVCNVLTLLDDYSNRVVYDSKTSVCQFSASLSKRSPDLRSCDRLFDELKSTYFTKH
jgi:hypothetical protein